MSRRIPRARPQPEGGHDWDDYSGYVPFDTVTVHERVREERPLLYDSSGKPLVHKSDVVPRVGFKIPR